jgi:hypothetical protein
MATSINLFIKIITLSTEQHLVSHNYTFLYGAYIQADKLVDSSPHYTHIYTVYAFGETPTVPEVTVNKLNVRVGGLQKERIFLT